MKMLLNSVEILSRLMRWEDYGSYVQLVLGYLLAKNFRINPYDILYLVQIFILFSPLLYGGLYSLNDVMDAERDARNSIKKDRPIPKGSITKMNAIIVSLALILSSVLLSLAWKDQKVQIILISFLGINVFYTLVAKHIPYVEFIFNTITHPLRLFVGAWLAGGLLPVEIYIVWFVAIFSGTVFRRIKEFYEGNESSRPVMRFYRISTLQNIYFSGVVICVILIFAVDDYVRIFTFLWSCILITIYIGYFKSKMIKDVIEFLWR